MGGSTMMMRFLAARVHRNTTGLRSRLARPRILRNANKFASALQQGFRYTSSITRSFTEARDAAISACSNGDLTYADPVLRGRCSCGRCGWDAHGPSNLNVVCHCRGCRKATGAASTAAAAFRPSQVKWINEVGMQREVPVGFATERLYCGNCGDYVGEDATTVLGVVSLPITLAGPIIAPAYRPNHHIFYADRIADAAPADRLPKWKTLPQGLLIADAGAPDGRNASGNAAEAGAAGIAAVAAAAASMRTVRSDGWAYTERGQFLKDILPPSPSRPPDAARYHFTMADPEPNHITHISPEKVAERVSKKYLPSPGAFMAPASRKRDVIVVGGGHNGLVSAAYLARAGLDVLVLERRHCLGGAAVTEEVVPGFKFSRASYLAGLLRPQVIRELELEKYGFKYLPRDPSSFTPTRLDGPMGGRYLMLGEDAAKTRASIAQFSAKDAESYGRYEELLAKIRDIVEPLLDGPPPNPFEGNFAERRVALETVAKVASRALRHSNAVGAAYELFTAPASHVLDRWFESEILKTTLATDAVIGAMCSPRDAGSGYVLLHHVMGEAAGKKGVWAYVEGGMGAVSEAIAGSARASGAEIVTNAAVKEITYADNGGKARATGVRMGDGTHLEASAVLSNATPYHTFLELLPGLSRDSGNKEERSPLPPEFQHRVRFADYSCGAFKMNLAVDKLPDFACCPSAADGTAGPQHRGTVHFESCMQEIEHAQREAASGIPAARPVIEMTIPSSLDRTISPAGKHVVQLFVQFAPYRVDPKVGSWADPAFKQAFADNVLSVVDDFAPGFSSSVVAADILSPLDLEKIFGLHQGNIFHGSLALHQLGYARPAHRTPLCGLYLCGAGAHPGGGVMGAAGRNCANVVLSDRARF